MPLFVRLAPESPVALIRRNGIRRLRKASGNRPGGIFAVPVRTKLVPRHSRERLERVKYKWHCRGERGRMS